MTQTLLIGRDSMCMHQASSSVVKIWSRSGVTDNFRGSSGNTNYLVEDERILEGVHSKVIGVGLEPD
jgi:hypothetical protein